MQAAVSLAIVYTEVKILLCISFVNWSLSTKWTCHSWLDFKKYVMNVWVIAGLQRSCVLIEKSVKTYSSFMLIGSKVDYEWINSLCEVRDQCKLCFYCLLYLCSEGTESSSKIPTFPDPPCSLVCRKNN